MIDANYGLSAVAMEIFKSSRGGDKLSFEGFVYRKNTSNITTQNWRCENKGCKGSVSTSLRYHTERQVVTRQIHNHPPVPARVEVVSALDKAMEQAETSNLRPRNSGRHHRAGGIPSWRGICYHTERLNPKHQDLGGLPLRFEETLYMFVPAKGHLN